MSLDLSRLTAQIGSMVGHLKETVADRAARLELALTTLASHAADWEKLQARIDAAKTTWLLADLVDGLDRNYPLPELPASFTVLATDGSQIEVDRHRYPHCYVVNIGSVRLHYGDAPGAALQNQPELCFADADRVITSPDGREERAVEGQLLGLKRGLAEWGGLLSLARELPPESQTLALVDGSLVLFGLEAFPPFVSDALLAPGYLKCLDEIRKLNAERRLAMASYISLPRSPEVVNALRLAICPFPQPDCDRDCPTGDSRKCRGVAGLTDRELFERLLPENARSPLFASRSKVVRKYYGEHRIYFYYVSVGDEIGRVELPEWVALDPALLDLSHALVIDQCRRGHGYPVALAEAHEQAVVTGADRENFWRLVETMLVRVNISGRTSAKSQRKRTRWI